MTERRHPPKPNRRALLRTLGAAGLAAASAHPAWAAGLLPSPPNLRAASGTLLPLSGGRLVGKLRSADANGLRLPKGFSSRIIARSGRRISGTDYVWHNTPDGGATIATDDGGWIYVGNSEEDGGRGGASAVVFDADARIIDAYRICSGTSRNCAGGMTPWNTYLSCEEVSRGRIYECDPFGNEDPVARSGMGRFEHEAAAVDPDTGFVYLTEDKSDGCLYRFVPYDYGDLSDGVLEVGCVDSRNRDRLVWKAVPYPEPRSTSSSDSTRNQVAGSRRFNGGEGCWCHEGQVYFTTKGDDCVWSLDVASNLVRKVYDASEQDAPVLDGVDNLVAASNGVLYVAEDGGNMQICLLGQDGSTAVLLQVTNQSSSELTGVAFSPDGSRLYFSSQRGTSGSGSGGITYELTGPFLSLEV